MIQDWILVSKTCFNPIGIMSASQGKVSDDRYVTDCKRSQFELPKHRDACGKRACGC